MNFRPRHFSLAELVNPDIFRDLGERAWDYLRPEGLQMIDNIRNRFGPVIINNWAIGGEYSESGLRQSDSKTGARYSMHKFGCAFDMKFQDATPQEVYDFILKHPDQFPEVTTMENIDATPTWLHADVRNHNRSGIWIVNP